VVEEGEGGGRRIIEAWNKLDLLDGHQREELEAAASGNSEVVLISAQTGEGLTDLEEHIASMLTQSHRRYRVILPLEDGAGAAWLHQHGEVLDYGVEGEQAWYWIRIAPSDMARFHARRDSAWCLARRQRHASRVATRLPDLRAIVPRSRRRQATPSPDSGVRTCHWPRARPLPVRPHRRAPD